MSLASQLPADVTENRTLLWIGRSGRQYRLLPESLSDFQLVDNVVHVLVTSARAHWAGSAADVVADPYSRTQFRRTMAGEVEVYRLEPTPDEGSRPLVSWDIVNGTPAAPLRLVGCA